MADVVLGEVTCPSGELMLLDGGYLGLWSGDRAPEEMNDDHTLAGVDFEIVGPDADAAARSFDRQAGRMLYDIPARAVTDFTTSFDNHCREHGLQAALRPFDHQIPHRERVRRAVSGGEPYLLVCGVSIVAVGGLPTDRPLSVFATKSDDWGWESIRIVARNDRVAGTKVLGSIGVDYARFAFADADALNAWIHEDPIDGLADVVFWGRDQADVASDFGAGRTGVNGDDNYGWLDLPVHEAYEKAVALGGYRNARTDRRFAFDFRPHSHHWQVMARVRASESEAGTVDIGGARIMFAMTSVGDGYFPVEVQLNEQSEVVAIKVTVTNPDDA